MTNGTFTNLSLLPPELIRYVCSFLSTADILNLELADKQQRQLICESGVWRDVILRWREDLKCILGEKMVKCTLVEQMANFLVKNGFKDSRYFKVFSGKMIKIKFSALSMSIFRSDPRSKDYYISFGVWAIPSFQEGKAGLGCLPLCSQAHSVTVHKWGEEIKTWSRGKKGNLWAVVCSKHSNCVFAQPIVLVHPLRK